MAARGGLSGVHNYIEREGCLKNPLTGASQRERTKPSPDTHLDSQSCPNLYITHTQRQIQTPKSKKPFKNVAREDTPSTNLQRKCASQRESYIYIYIRAPRRAPTPDTPLSGSLLRLLCHHVHMLANLTVCRK